MFFVKSLRAAETPRRRYVILLALCVWCLLCVPVCSHSTAQEALPNVNEVKLFDDNTVKDVLNFDSNLPETQTITVSKVNTYYLVSAGGFMTALINGEMCSEEKKSKDNFLAKYIEIKGNEWGKDAVEKINNSGTWKSQLSSDIKKAEQDTFAMDGFDVIVKDNEIHIIAVNIKEKDESQTPKKYEVVFKIMKRKVNTDEKTVKTKKIVWETKTSTLEDSTNIISDFKSKLSERKEYEYFAFITDDDKIGLMIREKVKLNRENSVFDVLKFETIEQTPKILFVKTAEKCPFSFFQWNKKLIIVPTECPAGSGEVKWSTNMIDWTNNEFGPFYHLWDILKDKSDSTTTAIGDKEILFFTEKKKERTRYGKKRNTFVDFRWKSCKKRWNYCR